jgi:sporulation protein YlmC with PRC-barrel domain
MIGTSKVLPTDKLKGTGVTNTAGEKLGKIEDFAIDMERGCIAYAVLSFGGFLGMGDKFFAIPWDALKPSPQNDEFVLGVEKEALKNAPGFDKDDWPDMADRRWGAEIHRYYGSQPYWGDL